MELQHQLKLQFPYLDDEEILDADTKPEALVAGCGTGRQSIENALLLPNTNFTAIDITAASLAYATRKTQEAGLQNIEYGLADILKLEELGKEFDVIYCGGVLHHMNDPMAGWQVLTDILKPGGYMMIALYSELARANVLATMEYIEQQAIEHTDDGIRRLRKDVLSMPDSHPMSSLVNHQDFYSLSECRDFLFHVQEHRFTALQLDKSVKQLGLRFLGFQPPAPDTFDKYSALFPDDPHRVNLKNWHEFELENPDTFKGMYHLWLQKPKD